jgi:hypothetical protein
MWNSIGTGRLNLAYLFEEEIDLSSEQVLSYLEQGFIAEILSDLIAKRGGGAKTLLTFCDPYPVLEVFMIYCEVK